MHLLVQRNCDVIQLHGTTIRITLSTVQFHPNVQGAYVPSGLWLECRQSVFLEEEIIKYEYSVDECQAAGDDPSEAGLVDV